MDASVKADETCADGVKAAATACSGCSRPAHPSRRLQIKENRWRLLSELTAPASGRVILPGMVELPPTGILNAAWSRISSTHHLSLPPPAWYRACLHVQLSCSPRLFLVQTEIA
ncbi:hypothetical protein VZT92_008322 [Zoarces viviparus]|uniref:Uncharacterized protein n=1 Tax=Zoarces viviparus TaxID=48416 RepID=A0AAW1FG48_ZOAVI